MQYILAGDVGGTKSNLAIYAVDPNGQIHLVREETFPSREYPSLEEVSRQFLSAGQETPDAAGFGIAGPVIDGAVHTTNLPWTIETRKLATALRCEKVRLLNDLEANAVGALGLPDDEMSILQPGVPRTGHRAVIAAGTGLGQAFLFWDGKRFHPAATEGGHADFAPRTELEVGLMKHIQAVYPHVSCERVLSGPGLVNIFTFLRDDLKRAVHPQVAEDLLSQDPGQVVGAAGVSGSCATCREAVDLFVTVYGAQAGNLVLTVMAMGGIYVGGGIVTKLLPRIGSGLFLEGFRAKGRYEKLMQEIPVRVILNPKTAQLGAARAAAETL